MAWIITKFISLYWDGHSGWLIYGGKWPSRCETLVVCVDTDWAYEEQ